MAYMEYKLENFVSFEKIEKIWEENKKPVIGYIHNPFCQGMNGKNCSFCVHRGTVGVDNKTVEEFYFEYLPKQFKQYENVIKNNNFEMICFGGGTPNYLSAENFDKFLSLLPKEWKSVPKQIELHAHWITKEFIDVLKKHNFKILTFCIQTFNEEILKRWNRLPSKENVLELMDYCHEIGIDIAVDLMTFWNADEEKDLSILEEDLKKISTVLPEEITISLLYQNRLKVDKQSIIHYLGKIRELRNKYIPNYINLEQSDTEENMRIAATRYFKANRKDFQELYFDYIKTLSPIEGEKPVATLAIGSYKGIVHDAYSIPNYNITYYEVNVDNKESKYYLAKNYNFWDEAIKLISNLKEEYDNKNPPYNSRLLIGNSIINNLNEISSCCEPNHLRWNFAWPENDDELCKFFAEKSKNLKNKPDQEFFSWLENKNKGEDENGVC